MIRVLITDDHLVVREGLHLILETADDIEVVGEAVAELQPTAVLVEQVGDGDGHGGQRGSPVQPAAAARPQSP